MVLGRSSEMEEIMESGRKVGRTPRKSRTYGENRICNYIECVQVVSRYNHQEYCFLHHRPESYRVRGHEVHDV